MWLWRQKIDSVHAFYVNSLLRSLFMSLTTIFVPLFIYSRGMSEWGDIGRSLILVAAYFIVLRVTIILIIFPVSKLIERIGFRRSITLSVIFLIIYTLLMLLASGNINWLWIAAIAQAINTPLYWTSRDSALSQDIPRQSMGSKISDIAVLESIASLLGPFTGGVIVLLMGYQALFAVSLMVLLLSILPLWWMPHHTHRNGVTLRGFWYFLTNSRYIHQSVGYFGQAMNDYGNAIVWPMVLLFQGITDEKLGALYSAAAVVTIVVHYLSGKWFDRLRARKDFSDEGVFGFTALWVAGSWVARLFVMGIWQVASVDMGRQIFGAMYSNFFNDYLHLGGKRMGSIAYWVYMEIIYSVGAIFMFSMMWIGVYFGVWKELVIATIALWSLSTIVIARESNLR